MPRQLARLDGQHLVKEPTEPDGTQRYSCETSAHPWPAEVLVRALRLPSLQGRGRGFESLSAHHVHAGLRGAAACRTPLRGVGSLAR